MQHNASSKHPWHPDHGKTASKVYTYNGLATTTATHALAGYVHTLHTDTLSRTGRNDLDYEGPRWWRQDVLTPTTVCEPHYMGAYCSNHAIYKRVAAEYGSICRQTAAEDAVTRTGSLQGTILSSARYGTWINPPALMETCSSLCDDIA